MSTQVFYIMMLHVHMTCAHSPVSFKSPLDCSLHLTRCQRTTSITVTLHCLENMDTRYRCSFPKMHLAALSEDVESTDAEALDMDGRLDWRPPQLQQDHSDDQESDVCDNQHRPDTEYRERCKDRL